MKSSNVNYQPLSANYRSPTPVKVNLGIYVVLPVVFSWVYGIYNLTQVGIPGLVFMIVVSVIVGIAGYFIGLKQTRKDMAWRDFASVNGWQLKRESTLAPPSIASAGHSKRSSEVISGKLGDHPFIMYTYKFTKGYGKGSRDFFYTIVHISLPRSFPHLILDSKRTPQAIQDVGDATAQVKLEGDFHKYFTLRYGPGGHIDALSVITPDVMQTLITHNAKQDIEIVDDNLYFMLQSTSRQEAEVRSLVEAVYALGDELRHKSKTIQYGR